MLYVNHELNYDRYNEHFDDIYRVAVDAKVGNTVIRQTALPSAVVDSTRGMSSGSQRMNLTSFSAASR